jgi:hypothetical protein
MQFIVLVFSLVVFCWIGIVQPFGLVWLELAIFAAVQVWIWGFWFAPDWDDDWDFISRIKQRHKWRDGWGAWCVDSIEPDSCWVEHVSYRSSVPALLHLLWCKLRYRDRQWEIHHGWRWL